MLGPDPSAPPLRSPNSQLQRGAEAAQRALFHYAEPPAGRPAGPAGLLHLGGRPGSPCAGLQQAQLPRPALRRHRLPRADAPHRRPAGRGDPRCHPRPQGCARHAADQAVERLHGGQRGDPREWRPGRGLGAGRSAWEGDGARALKGSSSAAACRRCRAPPPPSAFMSTPAPCTSRPTTPVRRGAAGWSYEASGGSWLPSGAPNACRRQRWERRCRRHLNLRRRTAHSTLPSGRCGSLAPPIHP